MSFMPPGAFITHLSDVLGFQKRRPVQSSNGFDTHYLDLTSLKLDLGPFVPHITCQQLGAKPIVSEDELKGFVRDLSKTGDTASPQVSILVLGGNLASISEDFRHELSNRLLALIDASTMTAIYSTDSRRSKQRLFVAALAMFIGRQALSPYTLGSPAWGGRFFGRSKLVKEIIGGGVRGNYTIVGSRRIGKTSLLSEIRYRFNTMSTPLIMSVIYGGSCRNTEDVLMRIMNDIAHTPSTYLNKAQLMRNFIDLIRHAKTPIMVFVDELDRIIDWDKEQRYETLDILREVFSADNRRIFFAGFRKTIEAQRDVESPLFNFTKPVFLGPLDQFEAKEMVREPMDLLGIEVPEALARETYRNTSGRPELLQFCCSELLRIFEDEERLPDADRLADHLRSSLAFAERVVASFLSSANEVEMLTCRLLAAKACDTGVVNEDYSFGLGSAHQELTAAFGRASMSDANNVLTNLVLLGAIVKIGGDRFRFAAPMLAEALAGVLRVENPSRTPLIEKQGCVESKTPIVALRTEAIAPDSDRHRVFISYTHVDLAWAQWIAWTLENLGHSVIFQAWDFLPGSNFVHQMHEALETANKLILVLSDEYLKSSFASSEWFAFFRTDPVGSQRKVLPIRIQECHPTGLLGSIVYVDLVDRNEAEAKRLLTSAFEDRLKPIEQPRFPRVEIATGKVPFPGS